VGKRFERAGERRLVDPMYRAETMVEEIADIYRRLLVERAEHVRWFDDRQTTPTRHVGHHPPTPVEPTDALPQSWSSSQPVAASTARKERD
jgi:hypothetical protein